MHNFDDEPIMIYSELDDDKFEVRKIHIYRNGNFGLSYQDIEFLNTRLGEVPVPEIVESVNRPAAHESTIVPRRMLGVRQIAPCMLLG
ncbi:hypothetical protein [Cohnella sp.]|uniref:DUF6881 domain-containing protein n=1 Tax=Cohnella sp. TaxID=1883426 RepID=UPI003568EF30